LEAEYTEENSAWVQMVFEGGLKISDELEREWADSLVDLRDYTLLDSDVVIEGSFNFTGVLNVGYSPSGRLARFFRRGK
jgi:hypothetical protein